MNNTVVSVIIPSYNHAAYVEYCLNSVLDQHNCEIDLIVVDDGSNDGSQSIISDWFLRHKKKLLSARYFEQSNHGLSNTLNRMLDLAVGDFIAPIASDDAFMPGGISVRVEALKKNNNWLAVIGDCSVMDGENNTIFESALFDYRDLSKRHLMKSTSIVNELVLNWQLPGPVLLARKSVYSPENFGRYSPDLIVEDRDFYLNVLEKKGLGFVDSVVSKYRVHENNAIHSRKTSPERYKEQLRNSIRVEGAHVDKYSGFARAGLSLKKKIAESRLNRIEKRGAGFGVLVYLPTLLFLKILHRMRNY